MKLTGDLVKLAMGNLTADGRLILHDLKFLPVNHGEFPALLLEEGDLLFNRTNSAELVGKTVVYSGLPTPCSFASYLIRIRLMAGIEPSIMAHALNGPVGRSWIKDVVTQTVGQANVNGTKLAAFAFPLPPFSKQQAVVELIEDQLSVVDHLESDFDAMWGSAQALRQSILYHAFTGQLLPQDPNDEPAAELLKRIAAERELRPTRAPRARPAHRRTGRTLPRD